MIIFHPMGSGNRIRYDRASQQRAALAARICEKRATKAFLCGVCLCVLPVVREDSITIWEGEWDIFDPPKNQSCIQFSRKRGEGSIPERLFHVEHAWNALLSAKGNTGCSL